MQLLLKYSLTQAWLTITLVLLLLLTSACSSDEKPPNTLWVPASYATETEERQAMLTLHYLDGVEDILQADILITRKDGSGPLFEVQDATVEPRAETLHFKWTDGFDNQGTAIIQWLDKNQQNIRLQLDVEHVNNERNMMFIDDYILKKQPQTSVEHKPEQTDSPVTQEQ